MNRKTWKKSTWLLIVLIVLGIALVVISELINNSNINNSDRDMFNNILYMGLRTLGFSFISSALITALKEKTEDIKIEDIKNDLAEMQKNTKNISEKTISSLTEMKNTVKQFSVNDRIVNGRHLEEQFPEMLQESVTDLDGIIKIDIKGMELYNFWKDQKDVILGLNKFHVRLLVQDPFSDTFVKMVRNEGINQEKVTSNIQAITKDIFKLEEEGKINNTDRKIKIRWLSFPASVTMTKVNNQMYVRARLMNSNNMNDLQFFEKYQKGDLPFNTYSKLFNIEWDSFDESPYEAKNNLRNYCIDNNK